MLFYFLFSLELILCFTLILIGFDENKAYKERQELYTIENQNDLYTLTDESLFMTDLTLYDHINDLNAMNLIYGHVSHGEYFNASGQVASFKIIEASESFFTDILNISPDKHSAYLSQNLSQKVKRNKGMLNDGIRLENDALVLDNLKLNLEDLPANKTSYKQAMPTNVFESGDIQINESVFVLMRPSIKGKADQTFLKLKNVPNQPGIEKKLTELLNREVYVTDLLADFERGSNSQAAFVRLFAWISTIAILIIIFGTSSMVLLFVKGRKEKNKIQYFYGASLLRLRIQLFLELFFIMLVSMIVSQVCAVLFESVLSSPYYLIRPQINSFIGLKLFCLVVSFCITIFASRGFEWEKIYS